MTHKHFGSLQYFQSADHPRVLFLAGMHGNEYESGQTLEEYIGKNKELFPHYLFIPRVSPSAVAAGTRRNAFGNDINRQFYLTTQDEEALGVMRLLSTYSFELVVDLHEDPDQKEAFYLYDSGSMNTRELAQYQACVRSTKSLLFSGLDDADDATLGCEIVDGYYSFLPSWHVDGSHDDGFSSKWMIRNAIAKRVFTLEIPGKADTVLKQSLIEHVIPFLISTFVVE